MGKIMVLLVSEFYLSPGDGN